MLISRLVPSRLRTYNVRSEIEKKLFSAIIQMNE